MSKNCIELGGLHKFEPRYDEFEDITKDVDSTHTSNKTLYVCDVCVHCGMVVNRKQENGKYKKEKEDSQIQHIMENGSIVNIEEDVGDDPLRGSSQISLLSNIALEQDIRCFWGDDIVDELLNIMDFRNILLWINEPNKYFGGMTPTEAVNKNGLKCLEDMLEKNEGFE